MNKAKITVVVGCLFLYAGAAAAQRSVEPTATALALPGERFVAIAPCRLLDTRTERAKSPTDDLNRTVKMADTRCGEIIPPYAAAYALRVITLRRGGPEEGPVAVTVAPAARVAKQASDLLQFPVAAASHLAVDIEGYYVPPGIPLTATDSAAASVAPTSAASTQKSLQPRAESISTDQTKGDLVLDATLMTATGARLEAHAATPYTVLRPGSSGGAVAFYTSGATPLPLMAFFDSGEMRLESTSFINGRFSYHPQPSQRVPTNKVNDISIDYPLDANGGTANRVVFYSAATAGENINPADTTPGPPTTKFQAYTTGTYPSQANINFDSQFLYHTGQYYFRGYSMAESKDTFWVKASPSANGNTAVDTRATMYVSGPAGFGTDTPLDAVHVKALSPGVRVEESAQAGSVAVLGDNTVDGPYLVSHTDTSGNATLAASAHRLRFGANLLAIDDAPAVGVGVQRAWTTRFQIGNTGAVTIGNPTVDAGTMLTVGGSVTIAGNINAKFQDVAEWVPASESMAAGTVVVVDPSRRNGVMPSGSAYQTSVAGVVSDLPGLLLGEADASKAKVATTGRVKVRVDASRAPIHAGDLLVTSDKPGLAMRSEPVDLGGVKIHRPGTLIGKALEPMERGEGEILVLLSLQ